MMTVKAVAPTNYRDALARCQQISKQFGTKDAVAAEEIETLREEFGSCLGVLLNEIGDDETGRFVIEDDLEKLFEKTADSTLRGIIQQTVALIGVKQEEDIISSPA